LNNERLKTELHRRFSVGHFGEILKPSRCTQYAAITKTVASITSCLTAIAASQTMHEHFLRLTTPETTNQQELRPSTTDSKYITPPTIARQTLTHYSRNKINVNGDY
jgi:hypothetical protein